MLAGMRPRAWADASRSCGNGEAMIEARMPISWSSIQSLREPDRDRHWARCRDELGLDCPVDVFKELFFEHQRDEEFGTPYSAAGLSAVALTEMELTGVVLRRDAIERKRTGRCGTMIVADHDQSLRGR
jgi:hypothetical protein